MHDQGIDFVGLAGEGKGLVRGAGIHKGRIQTQALPEDGDRPEPDIFGSQAFTDPNGELPIHVLGVLDGVLDFLTVGYGNGLFLIESGGQHIRDAVTQVAVLRGAADFEGQDGHGVLGGRSRAGKHADSKEYAHGADDFEQLGY